MFEGFGGILINMNFNEVIVNVVVQVLWQLIGYYVFVYFNDYVNMCQFINDVFLIVMKLGIYEVLVDILKVLFYFVDVFFQK